MQITVTVTGSKELQRAFHKLGASLLIYDAAMKDTGEALTDYYSTVAFASQGGVFGSQWARLSPRYAVQKAKTHPGRPILVKTGKMIGGFRYRHNNTSAEIYNRMSYFEYHQSTAEPRRRLPRRQTMGINAPVRRMIMEIFDKDIKQKIRKAGLK